MNSSRESAGYQTLLQKLTHSPEETNATGARLAEEVRTGDTIVIVGPLGAGKTTLVRGFIRALGFQGVVRSPSYTLVNRYPTRPPVTHVDLFRVEDLSELLALDLDDENEHNVLIVEWGDRFRLMPSPPEWRVSIDYAQPVESSRRILIEKLTTTA